MSTEVSQVSETIANMVKGCAIRDRVEVIRCPKPEELFASLCAYREASRAYRNSSDESYLYGRTDVREKQEKSAHAAMLNSQPEVVLRHFRVNLGAIADDGRSVALTIHEEDVKYVLVPQSLSIPGHEEGSDWTFVGTVSGSMTDCMGHTSWTTTYTFTAHRGDIKVEVS